MADTEKMPWFRFFPTNIEGDIWQMTPKECRAYWLLVCRAWKCGGRLPIESAVLARIAGTDAKTINSLVKGFSHLFTVDDDSYRIDIVEEGRQYAINAKQKKSAAGRLGARARWTPGVIQGGEK